ncbi:entericidin A/B family lipoprotein [Neisseria weaveri]|uniref:Entericidin A n=1 Tax=Neisseria weaveri TaxID=28091 RepID=A0A448VQS2_9NEIS|nr:entericidin A/B family lipoprotein [Neisseria weaveri]EGV34785.1 hypothetical protein l13_20460 [Neisseria weaveri ATCC 51223]EGV38053.1 hypothetical protein l11_07910 [Neisseria weaveri LMG 5135]VEJ52117.1 entericidin A [Neisseria weaveri]
MKKLALITIATVALLTGCNTIAGAGKDVSAVGRAVTHVAQ